MNYFKHIIISRVEDINSDNKNVNTNKCYKIRVLCLDDKVMETSELSFSELLNMIEELEYIYKSSFTKLVDCNVVSFSGLETKVDLMTYLENNNYNKGIDYKYDEKSDFALHIEPKLEDRDKYLLYIINSDCGNQDSILVNEEQKDIVVDIFKRTHNLNHYSIDKLIENGRIVSFDSNIDKLTVFSGNEYSNIKVEYSNGKVAHLDIGMFSILVNKLLKGNSNYKNPFYRLYKDGKIDFKYGNYGNLYMKNISSIKIKSNGDVLVKSRKLLPFRKKYNIMKQPKKVFDVISSFCYKNETTKFSNLVGKSIIFQTAKSNKRVLPNQIISGRFLDTSVKPEIINYKYYALYEDDYQEITKSEAAEYFNMIAKKKGISDIDGMFSKEYCKVMPLNNALDYVKNNIQNVDYINRGRNRKNVKESTFNKAGRFVKTLTKKLFGTPLKKAMAVTTAVCVAGVGVITSMFSKKSDFFENNRSSYVHDTNSDIDLLENSDSVDLVISNEEYNELLDKCVQNNDRRISMKKIGAYLEVCNTENNIYSHSFDEVFYEYLAYNTFSETQLNNVLGNENLDIDRFSQVLNYAIFKDAASHSNQTEPMNKTMIINSIEGRKIYQKYEDLFIDMNKTDDDMKKIELGQKFYDMVREDLSEMSSGRYDNVPQYMYIIEEFRQAMELNEAMSFNNKFTDSEKLYIKGILDNVIVTELKRIISCRQASNFVDEYYGNKNVDLCPTIEEFRDIYIYNLNMDDKSSSVEKEKTKDSTNKIDTSKKKEKDSFVEEESTEFQSNSTLYGKDEDTSINEKVTNEEDYNVSSEESDVVLINDDFDEESKTQLSTSSEIGVCEIFDHNLDGVNNVEGTVSSEDMKLLPEDLSDEGYVDVEDPVEVTSDEIIEYVEINFDGSADYYEDVTNDNFGNTPYNPNDSLPNPNNISEEEYVDYLVESMASSNNNYEKGHLLVK